MNNEITDQFLNEVIEKFSKEQMRILGELKQGQSEDKDKDAQKQMTFLNGLVMSLIRFRNYKKQQQAKINN